MSKHVHKGSGKLSVHKNIRCRCKGFRGWHSACCVCNFTMVWSPLPQADWSLHRCRYAASGTFILVRSNENSKNQNLPLHFENSENGTAICLLCLPLYNPIENLIPIIYIYRLIKWKHIHICDIYMDKDIYIYIYT